jgi:hypothetical protein
MFTMLPIMCDAVARQAVAKELKMPCLTDR